MGAHSTPFTFTLMYDSFAFSIVYHQTAGKPLSALLAVTDGRFDAFSDRITDPGVMAAVEALLELDDANRRSCRVEVTEPASLHPVDTLRALFWHSGALPGTGRSHDIGLDALLPQLRAMRFAAEVLIDDCVTALREQRGQA